MKDAHKNYFHWCPSPEEWSYSKNESWTLTVFCSPVWKQFRKPPRQNGAEREREGNVPSARRIEKWIPNLATNLASRRSSSYTVIFSKAWVWALARENSQVFFHLDLARQWPSHQKETEVWKNKSAGTTPSEWAGTNRKRSATNICVGFLWSTNNNERLILFKLKRTVDAVRAPAV